MTARLSACRRTLEQILVRTKVLECEALIGRWVKGRAPDQRFHPTAHVTQAAHMDAVCERHVLVPVPTHLGARHILPSLPCGDQLHRRRRRAATRSSSFSTHSVTRYVTTSACSSKGVACTRSTSLEAAGHVSRTTSAMSGLGTLSTLITQRMLCRSSYGARSSSMRQEFHDDRHLRIRGCEPDHHRRDSWRP